MSAETATPVQSEKQQKIIAELNVLGDEIALARKHLRKLIKQRNTLLARGVKANITYAEMGRAAGIRRETAHYAVLRSNGGSES